MDQEQWKDYLRLLRQLTQVVSQLAGTEQKKAKAASRGDVAGVDECMKQEQVLSLSLRGIEQKRDAMLRRLGLGGLPLRELPEHSPGELAAETRQVADELRRQYDLFRSASDTARRTLEINLRAIELYCAEENIELPKEMEKRRQTDFRA